MDFLSFNYLFPASWSPDGNRLAAWFNSVIVLIDVASAEVHDVKVSESRRLAKPIFSPDGRFLAFTSYDSPQSGDVFIMDVDGNGETPVSEHPANDRLVGWTLDGDALLFMSDRGGTDDLWAVAVEEGMTVGEPVVVVPELRTDDILGLTDSCDLVYEVRVGEPSSFVATMSEPEARSVQATTMISPGWYAATWSPDGQYLASNSWESWGGGIDIIAAATGAKRAAPVPEGYQFGRPTWAPDGRSLVVHTWDRNNRNTVSLVDVETGTMTELFSAEAPYGGTQAADPVLGIDKNTLYFVRKGGVLARDLGTGQEQTLFTGPPDRPWVQGIALSPEGDQLAVAHATPGVFPGLSNTISIVELSGSSREIVRMEPGEYLRNIRWTPSDHIVFLKSGGSGADTELWRLNVGDGSLERIQFPVDSPPIRGLGNFHPDGRKFTYASQGHVEVWIMEGLAGAVRHALGVATGQR